MSAPIGNLEIQGILLDHPFAELLVEISEVQLSGSLRISHETQKIIVYLRKGEVVFAVSNSRRHRLFEKLRQTGLITKERLAEFSNFTNDLEFSQSLIEKEILPQEMIDKTFSQIIEEILKTAFQLEDGEWLFSPLARIRESIEFQVDLSKLLLEYARNRSVPQIAKRFKSLAEIFQLNPVSPQSDLLPHEGFIFSRFEDKPLTVHEVQVLSGLPESEVLKSLYILWAGGFIKRENWQAAFTESKIAAINSAKLTLKKDESALPEKQPDNSRLDPSAPKESARMTEVSNIAENIEAPLSEEEYLDRVETAENYYEMFDLEFESSASEIKTAYFALAKNFHPDKYHQESDSALQQRIQHAFTEIAKAYETLKSPETRQIYDFRLRKNIEMGISPKKSSPSQNLNDEDKAKEEFEQGFNLLMNEDYESALPYLTRAIQLAPNIARYHAYFGKALSTNEKQRFKADAEFQTAIRLEPNNPTFRLLLAEFYIQYNLLKRAEGELNRLLAMVPNNREAQNLLDTLANK